MCIRDSSSANKSERYAYLWKTSNVTLAPKFPVLISELSSKVEREPYLAKFRCKNEVLTILNYHACTHTKYYPERAEIAAITSWIKSHRAENIIWAGDMNLVIDDKAFDDILAFNCKSALHGEKTSLKKSCKSGEYLSRAEDNLIYSLRTLKYKGGGVLDFIQGQNCDDVSWIRNSYSDHLPVALKLSSE